MRIIIFLLFFSFHPIYAMTFQETNPVPFSLTGNNYILISNPYIQNPPTVHIVVNTGTVRILEGPPGCTFGTLILTNESRVCRFRTSGRLKFAASSSHKILASGTYQLLFV